MSGQPAAPVPGVKGIAFNTLMASFLDMEGAPVHERMVASLPTPLREAVQTGRLLASSWYPSEWYRELWQAIRRVTGKDAAHNRQLGKECIRRDMNTVYRVALKALSPETVFSVLPRLWGNYYNTGSLHIVEKGSGFVRAEWRGCTGFDRNMWEEVAGSSEGLLEMAGAKSPQVRFKSGGGDGDVDSDVHATWT